MQHRTQQWLRVVEEASSPESSMLTFAFGFRSSYHQKLNVGDMDFEKRRVRLMKVSAMHPLGSHMVRAFLEPTKLSKSSVGALVFISNHQERNFFECGRPAVQKEHRRLNLGKFSSPTRCQAHNSSSWDKRKA